MSCPLCAALDLKKVDTKIGDFFRCRHCDLISRSPDQRLNETEEKERYETHNNDVADPRYQHFVRPVVDAICARVPSGNGLDFGAGTGPVVAKLFTDRNYKMDRYDPYFWPDTTPLSSQFDFVCASEVVEHFYEPAQEFRLLRRLLKPGRPLGIMTLMHNEHTDFSTWYYLKDPTHSVFYSRKTFHWIADNFHFAKPEFPEKRVVILSGVYA